MGQKVVIEVEDLGNNEYRITAEDDVAKAVYTTTQPRVIIQDVFKEFKIVGRRGRRVGYRKAKPEAAAVSTN